MKDSAEQTTLLPANIEPAPTTNTILTEQDLGKLRTYALLGGAIQSISAYCFHARLQETGHGKKGAIAKQFYEGLGWKKSTYHNKVRIGKYIADNPSIDTASMTDKDILIAAGALPNKSTAQKKLIKAPIVPTNSAIFKSQIIDLKEQVKSLEETIEELTMERDALEAARDEAVEWVQSLQEDIAEMQAE